MFILLLLFVGLATFVRLYVFEPVKIMDSSMAPTFKEKSVVWMCKVPQCLNHLEDQKIVWAKLKSQETQVRSILAMPGDSIEISDKGKIKLQRGSIRLEDEDAFIQTRQIYVPKKGDTLVFDELNDVEQDYLISYLRDKCENILVKTTLWQGHREINIERVGSTKIANRQVSLNEIDFLPWQDRYLIEEQIRLSEPGNAPIKLKRQLYYGKIQVAAAESEDSTTTEADSAKFATDSSKQDSIKADSAKANPSKMDSADKNSSKQAQTIKVYGEQIAEIVMKDDCFYLVCKKGFGCPDSRELGYFTRNQIIGSHVAWPDRIKVKFIDPAAKRIVFVRDIFVDVWTRAMDWLDQTIEWVKDKFEDTEKDGEANPEGDSDEESQAKSNGPAPKRHGVRK